MKIKHIIGIVVILLLSIPIYLSFVNDDLNFASTTGLSELSKDKQSNISLQLLWDKYGSYSYQIGTLVLSLILLVSVVSTIYIHFTGDEKHE